MPLRHTAYNSKIAKLMGKWETFKRLVGTKDIPPHLGVTET